MKTFTQSSGNIQTKPQHLQTAAAAAAAATAVAIPHCDNNLYITAVARCQPLYGDVNI